ncbi:type 1 glutamine amidotransferase domain-containing protein [Acidovorax sp. GBBC 3334]|uniref:type 1 glutamine amidotransferase domain-containing protein n=1 Tax=Acidovorax sp. GBBC 3334 TaxID=2940496 RepID=UPI0023033E61|nr:type 1 glutamine amidotransferase domain-containing protein [Acidovorax sp. GBBC 3334]MDA8455343.1 type 1 glutamine amidotransferase domain-containing protein [Acidovorax sp. GBBC 3334]
MKPIHRRAAVQAVTVALAAAAGHGRAATPHPASGSAAAPRSANRKILIVVSSHDRKGDNLVAGFWFPELTHPAKVFAQAGYDYDIASPQGGMPPFDGFDLQDEGNRWFWIQPEQRNRLAHSLPLARVDASRYEAVVLVGGHGPMWDFAGNRSLHAIVRSVYERGGVVGAVCHGPAGLLGLQLSDGRSLIAGRRLTSFTNDEEASRHYDRLVPFKLESALEAESARFEKADVFQSRVVVDGRLVTGQNPASAQPFGEAVVALLGAQSL